jgi:hypothetical protein
MSEPPNGALQIIMLLMLMKPLHSTFSMNPVPMRISVKDMMDGQLKSSLAYPIMHLP